MQYRSNIAKKRSSIAKKVGAFIKGSFLFGLGVFLIYMFYLGHEYLPASENFSLSEIMVAGNRSISTDDIKGLLKLMPGENILKINLGSVIERLRVHPWIKRVSIKRVLPTRTLYIIVEEREPIALVDYNGALYLTDTEGVIIERVENEVGARRAVPLLPIIYGVDLKGVRFGDLRSPEGLKVSLEFLRFISTLNNVRPEELSTIKIGFKVDGLILHWKDYRIKVARDEYKEKWNFLSEVVRDMELKGRWPMVIDLRFSDMVIVRPL